MRSVVERRNASPGPRAETAGFAVAAVLGCIHAAFSFYWAAGGTALTWSLGTDQVEAFRGRERLLALVGVVKLTAAMTPLVWAHFAWPGRRLTRTVCWLGALVLVSWGGVNTVVANLVLDGAIHPERGFDRAGMSGHAYIWDPLFLFWGAAVATGLVCARRGRSALNPAEGNERTPHGYPSGDGSGLPVTDLRSQAGTGPSPTAARAPLRPRRDPLT